MRECFQFESMSILDHGVSVRDWYQDLKRVVLGLEPSRSWKLPSWILSPLIRRFIETADDEVMELYQIYHDCGKPLCRTVDQEGRQHFPDHAIVSSRRWMECSDRSPGAFQVGNLMLMDMDVHTLKACDVEEFARRPQALALLLTGLCELHSNAQMFGGIDSTGFKIKFKNIERFGARIVGAGR